MTALENLLLAIDDQPSGSLLSLFNPLRRRRVRAGHRSARTRALETAETLGLQFSVDKPAGTLSGGQLKLLSLGVALLGRPKLLLLDEPMAGVNRVLVERISGVLAARHHEDQLPMILIEHDLAVVEALCKRVVVLDNGRIIADGAPAAIREDAQVKAAYLGRRAGSVR
jgi:ABC-type branched-subunit amino acid transport system ATPase component